MALGAVQPFQLDQVVDHRDQPIISPKWGYISYSHYSIYSDGYPRVILAVHNPNT
jgi:hypothetical protein